MSKIDKLKEGRSFLRVVSSLGIVIKNLSNQFSHTVVERIIYTPHKSSTVGGRVGYDT